MTPPRCLVAIAALAAVVQAEDWPQYRGPNRDGNWTETGLIESIPAGGLPVKWRQPVKRGWASPAVAGGRVFVPDVVPDESDPRERIQCFDEKTGDKLWEYTYQVIYPDWGFHPEYGSGPSATPIVENERVYMIGANGHVHCLDAGSGEVVWENNLGETFDIPVLSCRSSPLIEGDLVVFVIGSKPDAAVLALDKHSGKESWRAVDDRALNSSTMVIEVGGAKQMIAWLENTLVSLVPETGEVLWKKRMTTSNNDGVSTPLFQDGRLLVGGLMMEYREGEVEPEILWPDGNVAARKRILSNTSTAAWSGDYLYSAKMEGELACIEAATGREVWSVDTLTGRKQGASIHIALADGGAFLFTDEGNLVRCRLTPEGIENNGQMLAIEPTAQFFKVMMVWTPPSYANGCGFFRNDKEVVCISLSRQVSPGK